MMKQIRAQLDGKPLKKRFNLTLDATEAAMLDALADAIAEKRTEIVDETGKTHPNRMKPWNDKDEIVKSLIHSAVCNVVKAYMRQGVPVGVNYAVDLRNQTDEEHHEHFSRKTWFRARKKTAFPSAYVRSEQKN